MPKLYEGEPVEESRQYYVTVRIQDYQRKFSGSVDFRTMMIAFRTYGLLYDVGHRLRDTYWVNAA